MSGELRPCGTRAAYKRHVRYGEKPCPACRKAENSAKAEHEKRSRQRPPLFRGPKPLTADPVVPYRYRARRYAWAVRVLARAEATWGRPDGEEAA